MGGYTFPVNAGNAGDVLVSDGLGNADWVDIDTAACPTGFTDVNGSMCIQTDENFAATWFVANTTCIASGYKLPTWGEWYGAVTNAVLNDEIDNWEWVDGGTSNTARKVGNAGVKNTANDNPDSGSEAYRCVMFLK